MVNPMEFSFTSHEIPQPTPTAKATDGLLQVFQLSTGGSLSGWSSDHRTPGRLWDRCFPVNG